MRIDGLDALKTVGEDLSIYQNEVLCQSDAEAFAAATAGGGDAEVG